MPRCAVHNRSPSHNLAGLILASLVAGLATTPYGAYHFHRAAPYGVLANLLAMPVVSALVILVSPMAKWPRSAAAMGG